MSSTSATGAEGKERRCLGISLGAETREHASVAQESDIKVPMLSRVYPTPILWISTSYTDCAININAVFSGVVTGRSNIDKPS